ncbi:hypothetical protein Q4Q65_19165, partial [Morganella morganii]
LSYFIVIFDDLILSANSENAFLTVGSLLFLAKFSRLLITSLLTIGVSIAKLVRAIDIADCNASIFLLVFTKSIGR